MCRGRSKHFVDSDNAFGQGIRKNPIHKILSYRIILEEYMAPLILDKEEEGDDADDHGAGNTDHNYQPAVHLRGDLIN